MGHVDVGHRWDRVAMELLDMSVTTAKGNWYVLVMVDCFSRRREACPLPDKTALAAADAFFQHIVCRFGMPMVIPKTIYGEDGTAHPFACNNYAVSPSCGAHGKQYVLCMPALLQQSWTSAQNYHLLYDTK